MSWISVKDRLPDFDSPVLIWYDFYPCNGNSAVAFLCNYDYWELFHVNTNKEKIETPTHWMPLPEPPK